MKEVSPATYPLKLPFYLLKTVYSAKKNVWDKWLSSARCMSAEPTCNAQFLVEDANNSSLLHPLAVEFRVDLVDFYQHAIRPLKLKLIPKAFVTRWTHYGYIGGTKLFLQLL